MTPHPYFQIAVAPQLLLLCALSLLCSTMVRAVVPSLDDCNVAFDTPSADASGAMPIGNGDVGASVWVEPDGDLVFYLCRSDSFSEASRLLKLGKVRVRLTPSPLGAGVPFHQVLRLRQGRFEVDMGDTHLEVFADPGSSVVRVLGRSVTPRAAKVLYEGWRTDRRVLTGNERNGSSWTMSGAPASVEVAESADVVVGADRAPAALAWYHHNADSVVPVSLKLQSCDKLAGAFDPYLNRTFGAWIEGGGFVRVDGTSIATRTPTSSFDLRIACPLLVTADPGEWVALARKKAQGAPVIDAARTAAEAWWGDFWNRSWILVSAGAGSSVPTNKQPLRMGIDSGGGNRFAGVFGRVGIYARPLSGAEIARLAAGDSVAAAVVEDRRIVSAVQPAPGTLWPEHARLDFKDGYTLEAWIKPDSTQGRIFDKLTAGSDNGFLLDLQGTTLRLIAGDLHLVAPAAVRPGAWQHVAATGGPDGQAALYVDGREVATTGAALMFHDPISAGYNLQRYVFACEGRGEYPIKFNGGIFTVEPKFANGAAFNADWRQWGDCFWFQNTRHMYHPMLAAGDFDLMAPFFAYYERCRPLAESRVKSWFGADGCYFPETMTPFGTYANGDYGWDRGTSKANDVHSPWWRYAWNQGPELVSQMLDYYDWTRDDQFAREQLIPMASSVLRYFDSRFRKDEKGHVVLDPAQAVETYWSGVINDMPTVAGIRAITDRLVALPDPLVPAADRALFARMQSACPAIPTEDRTLNGATVRSLAPAEKYTPKTTNCENPELYAVWPYRLYGVGKPDPELARNAYATRKNHLDNGWGYDGNVAALLGLTEEAARILQGRCRNSHGGYRFPATWGPNFDWLPDQNHGGNLMEMAQLMLLQVDGRKIWLLPAWPKDWDVDFRLHAPGNTIVEGAVTGGKLTRLKVTPDSRFFDVEICPPFTSESQATDRR